MWRDGTGETLRGEDLGVGGGGDGFGCYSAGGGCEELVGVA